MDEADGGRCDFGMLRSRLISSWRCGAVTNRPVPKRAIMSTESLRCRRTVADRPAPKLIFAWGIWRASRGTVSDRPAPKHACTEQHPDGRRGTASNRPAPKPMPPESGRERGLFGTDVDETRGFLAPRPSRNGVFSDLLRRQFRGRPAYTGCIIGGFGARAGYGRG